MKAKKIFEIQEFNREESNPLKKIDVGQSHLRRDKNGRSIKIGDNVNAPEPIGDDLHQYEFFGTVDSFRDEMVIVVDQEDEYYEFEPERLEIVDSYGEPLKESTIFNKSEKNPFRKLGIGKSYEIWRINHEKKPILNIVIYLQDSFNNKKRYQVNLFYRKNKKDDDTIWFGREKLIEGWQLDTDKSISIDELQNKPNLLFENGYDEARWWIDEYHFNEDVIDSLINENSKEAKEFMNNLSKAWFEQDFEIMMENWFSTGSNIVKKIKYNVV
ncbi:MAG: hypothetical protein PHF86_01830 [Candidatus Nanoarchaeia archaeon]|nr:hypothetical protein [Candidatus Nanoarchaeia archaeon]